MPFYDSAVTSTSTRNRPHRLLAALFALVLVISACGSSDEDAASDTTTAALADEGISAGNDAAEADSPEDNAAPTDDATEDATDEGAAEDVEPAAPTEEANDDADVAAPTDDIKRTRLGDKITVSDQSQGIDSARFEALISIEDSVDFPGGVEFSMEGAFSGTDSEVSLDFGTLAEAALAEEAGDLGAFAALFEEPMVVRTVGDRAYISWALLTMFSGAEGTWIETEVDEADTVTNGFGGDSPADFLASLEDANAEITELGTEVIRGVETTHLLAMIDLAELSSTMSPEEQAALESDFGDLDTTAFPIEFWIDGDGLLRRYSMEVEEDAGGAVAFVFELFDYGADITIEAPPADQIIPADQLDLESFGF